MQNLMRNVKVTRVLNAVAAGSTDITTATVIDMAGYEGVAFVYGFGTITAGAVTSVKVQQGTDATVTDAADLEGSSQSVADDADNKVFISDIFLPRERYVKPIIKRATQNAVVDFVLAIQYGPRTAPVTHDSTTVGGAEYFASPAEGTA